MGNAFDIQSAPDREPLEIVQGDFVQWRRSDLAQDYPPNDYSLSYLCRSEGIPARKIEIAATAANGAYLIQVPSSTTAQWIVGNYHWSATITRLSDQARVTVDNGLFSVTPDKNISADDPRSLPLKMLSLIEAALLHRAENHQLDVLAYSMGAETSATRDPAKLLEWRSYWRRELMRANRRAQARKGKRPGSVIGVRF